MFTVHPVSFSAALMHVRPFSLSSTVRPTISLLIAVTLGTIACIAMATDVWIITDHQHPVRSTADARVIELDAPSRIEAALSAGLPADLQQATALMQQRLKTDDAARVQELAAAYQGVADAWSLGVITVPAVIVDRHYVVYGDPDAAHAVARIKAWREAHP